MEGDREERAKQREMMKEMRARREAERMVESRFREEVIQQRAEVKEVSTRLLLYPYWLTNCLLRSRPRARKEGGKEERNLQGSLHDPPAVTGRLKQPRRPPSRHRDPHLHLPLALSLRRPPSRIVMTCTNLPRTTNQRQELIFLMH